MSDLQLALLAIGAVVVAAVFGYNVWQQRRLCFRTEQPFKDKPGDALFGGGAPAASSVERIEPTPASGEAPPPPVAEAADPGAEPDADVECVAEIQLAAPAPAASATASSPRPIHTPPACWPTCTTAWRWA